MSEQATWIGPYKPLAGGWETWRLMTLDATVELTVTRRLDSFVWVTELSGEEIDAGPAEDLPEAQQAAMDELVAYAVCLAEVARSLTLTIETPEER